MTDKKDNNLVHELIQKIDNDAKNAENYYALALALVKQEEYDQAEELLIKAQGVVETSGKELLQYGLGNVYYAAGLYDQAISVFQQLKSPKYQKDANMMIAQGYYAQSHFAQAFAFGLTAWEQDKSDFDINELMGDISLAMGEIEHAQNYYDQALKVKETAKLLFNRGVVEMTLNKNQDNEFFRKSNHLDSDLFFQNKQRLIDIDKLINQSEEEN